MKKLKFMIAAVMLVFLSCSKDDNLTEETQQPSETQGYNMLLIGNSFFKPYAQKLDEMAVDAGFVNHISTRITRGGDNGRPINFWNDSDSAEHSLIKSILDQGDIDIFGMTAGHDPDDRITGYRAWIEYALQNNPEINIFIAIPQIDFPETWDSLAQANGFNTIQEYYDYAVNNIVHDSIVDPLRTEFPNTKIFTVPTGWASFDLAQMKLDNDLLDNIDWFGPEATSLFTDQKGHQGNIIVETGSLVWLNSIYNVDLITHDYETGFNTDLHEIAKQITDNHDSNYKQ
jgi:hypothetical protein